MQEILPDPGGLQASDKTCFTQCKTTYGTAENKSVEMKSFFESEIWKLKDGYEQEPGESHTAWLVHLFDEGALQTLTI